MLTVLRVFLIDSMAYKNVKTQVTAAKPDVVEVLPGMMPKVIGKICKDLPGTCDRRRNDPGEGRCNGTS